MFARIFSTLASFRNHELPHRPKLLEKKQRSSSHNVPRIGISALLCVGLLGLLFSACQYPDEGFGRIGPIKKWGLDLKSAIHALPVVDRDGNIYVGTADGRFLSLNSSASIRWETKLNGIVLSPSISPSGVLVVNTHKGFIEAFHLGGRSLWKHQPRKLLFGCPPAYGKDEKDQEVVFTAGDLVLVAYTTQDGKPYTLGKKLPLAYTCPVVGPDNTLYYGDREYVYAWDIKTRTERWRYFFGKRTSGPAVDRSGHLFFGTTDARLVSLTAQGKFRWHYLPPDVAKTWKPASRPTSGSSTSPADEIPKALSQEELRAKLMKRIQEMMKKRASKRPPGLRKGPRPQIPQLSPHEKLPAFGPTAKQKHKKIYPFTWPTLRPDGEILTLRHDKGAYIITQQGLLRTFVKQAEGSFRGRPLVDNKGRFFLGSRGAFFYAYAPDGRLVYDFFTGGEVITGAAFSPDQSTAYFGTMSGHFYAVHAQKR